jgi:anti-sigma factor RsiW
MITCRELAALLVEFASPDQVPAEHRERVEQHLFRCPSCVAYVESYHLTIRLARQLPRAPLPSHLAQRLRALLQEGRSPETVEGQKEADSAAPGP